MNSLQIILIVIGIIVIIVSCLIVDKSQKPVSPTGKMITSENALSNEDRLQLKHRIEELLEASSEEIMIQADDELSRISNEKIMAVNEFSEQILEKITRNHEEVIFLYNMLSDKEKELKETVREIDSSKKKIRDSLDTKETSEKISSEKDVKMNTKPVTQADSIDKMSKTANDMVSKEQESSVLSMARNSNTQILSLYSEGKSIIEISKLLDLGQGEVKLVIDLFKGKSN